MRNLKMMPDYYNRQQETLIDFFKDSKKMVYLKPWMIVRLGVV